MTWGRRTESQRLLDIAEKIEQARASLDTAKKAADGSTIAVIDRLVSAIVEIDGSLAALDVEIGNASRKERREESKPMAVEDEVPAAKQVDEDA